MKRTSLWLLLDALVATIAAILGNIVASYLQERFNLTDSVRFLSVAILFLVCLGLLLVVTFKRARAEALDGTRQLESLFDRLVGDTDTHRAQRNRQAMLQLVYNTWIKGVLEQSLHGAAMIELGIEERPEAVDHPWDMVVQMPDQPRRQLPRGTRILDVFEEANQALLILGEPGSGKTTMLLELARDTIARAERDPAQPIPVVFNLSSWAEKRLSIADWLVEELNTKYNIPKRIARPWVENDALLLLLDGLDEVQLGLRHDCVQALNVFCQEHWVPLAICSRIAEYEALATKLKLRTAISLQPLTPERIDEYLETAGTELLAVRRTLQHDPVLQELAQTPLMLSIMTLACRGMLAQDLGALRSIELRRQHLFDAYVEQMFERRGADHPYAPEQTIHWLAWLARKMSEHAQTIFLIEELQPDWLPDHERRKARILVPLIVGLVFGLVFGLAAGLVAGLVFGLVGGYLERRSSAGPVEKLGWSWRPVLQSLVYFAVSGLVLALVLGQVGLLFGGLLSGLFCGIGFGLVPRRMETKTVPNQGIRQSAKNAAVVGLFSGLALGLFAGLVVGLRSGLRVGLSNGLPVGLISGSLSGLIFGGFAVLVHFALRYVLIRSGHIPWRYARFLDYAAERIFLRKVGGGYIFIHRLLMHYFASLYTEAETRGRKPESVLEGTKGSDTKGQPLGTRLQEARRQAGLTQEMLAGQVGVSPSTVSQWERGEVVPKAENRLQVIEVLGCDPWAEGHHA